VCQNQLMNDIARMFEPKSIAIVGASSNPFAMANVNFLNPLLEFGYKGKVYPVNRTAGEIAGLRAYASIRDIPGPVDYVICAVPASATPELMRECVAAKVKTVAIFTAGFSETGEEEGMRLERQLVEIARQGGVRMLGPNCLGVHCPAAGLSLDAYIPKESGHVGFLSQSGGNAQDTVLGLAERAVYISKLASFGNAADLNESDILEYLVGDDDTRIIGAYIEGIKQPVRFLRAARAAVDAGKPVIVLKGGKSDAGGGAVRLHTGALAGSKETWDAVCRQAGIIQVGSLKELADTIQAFHYLKTLRGRRVGIVGVGGGANVLAADDCESAGLVVPPLPAEIRQRLREFTPLPGTGLRNPVDTLTDIYLDPPMLARTFEIVAGWEGFDIMLVVFPTLLGVRLGVEHLSAAIEAVTGVAKGLDKPVAMVLRSANFADGDRVACEMLQQGIEAGLPVFWSFAEAARAVDRVVSYYQDGR